jgi:hypothetical protein
MNEMTHAKATAQTARGWWRMLGVVVTGDEFTVDSSRGVVDEAAS